MSYNIQLTADSGKSAITCWVLYPCHADYLWYVCRNLHFNHFISDRAWLLNLPVSWPCSIHKRLWIRIFCRLCTSYWRILPQPCKKKPGNKNIFLVIAIAPSRPVLEREFLPQGQLQNSFSHSLHQRSTSSDNLWNIKYSCLCIRWKGKVVLQTMSFMIEETLNNQINIQGVTSLY